MCCVTIKIKSARGRLLEKRSRNAHPPSIRLKLVAEYITYFVLAWPGSGPKRWCTTVHRNQFGDRCFATAGPTLWNSLPEQLRQPDITFGQFKRSLKTFVWLVARGALSPYVKGAD